MLVTMADVLWFELLKITKMYAQARSCRKIGSLKEAEAFEEKADELAIKWCRKQRPKEKP